MKWEIRQKVDLQVMTPQRATPECLFMVGNAQAHRWKVEVYSGGTPVDIDGRLVVAMVQRPDGLVAMLKGIAQSNVAEVVLDSACCGVAGHAQALMTLTSNDQVITVAEMRFRVGGDLGDTVIDSSDMLPSLSELLSQVADMRAATEECVAATDEMRELLENDAGYVSSIMPDYVAEEAERVAAAVSAVRTSKSLVLLCASDIHTLKGNAQSVETTLHLAQGMSEICKRVAVDGIAILGDSAFGSSTSTAEETKFAFAHLRENLVRGEHEIWIPGNHDHFGISDDGNYLSADELYSYIGANTTDKAVTDYDNLHRMYGYVDYDKQRIRVVYLNTSDITDSYASDYGMSTVQAQWFVDTLAAVPSGWGVVVLSHHPLNGYISAYLGTLTILDAYKGKESGSVTVGGGTVTYDYTDVQGEFICHLHGHIHNYQVKVLGDNGILSVTIPNGYFWRNNEYGTGGNTDWGDEVDGEQRVIDKTAGTAEDTAYTAVVIDRKHGKVHALRCGAGVDRVWDYINGVEVGGDETPDVPVEPDEPDTPTTGYTNQIPISVNTDGSVYNGTGYKAGYRISTSQGTESAASSMTVTGYIPLPKADSVVRVKDIELNHTDSTMGRYTSDFTFAGGDYCNTAFGAADESGVRSFTNTSSNCQWIRISGVFGDNPIITVDEEIG